MSHRQAWAVAGLALLACPPRAFAVAEDPLGFDPGEARDAEAFQDWAKDPRSAPRHPLGALLSVVHNDPKQRRDYFAFFFKQTGLLGRAAQVTEVLAETVAKRAPFENTPPASLKGQKQDAALAARLAKTGAEFFRLVPRVTRVRVYKVAEKFEAARLATLDLVRMGQTEVTDAWLEQQKADESHREEGYLSGMAKGKDPATARAIDEDFKLTVEFFLTFAGPPPYVHGEKARNKVRADKRKRRAQILKSVEPVTF